MGERATPGTLLDIPLVEEKYGKSFLLSVGLHVALVGFLLLVPYLIPAPTPIQIGTGPGGGTGGDSYSVGVADELSGGAGMTKPSLVPKPPALPEERAREEPDPAAVALPDTIAPKKPKAPPKTAAKTNNELRKPVPPSRSNAIPTAPEPGSGGTGAAGGGSGGGIGGGHGVSIGSGSGGIGDSWYARSVEARISQNWIRPPEGVRMDAAYSFFIAPDGSIYNVKRERSSGNNALDLTAERAIRASNPLSPPPPFLVQGRPLQFMAEFVYPPTP